MPEDPLGPGEDHVVVGEDRARRRVSESIAVDPGGAGDQPVRRRPLEQLTKLTAGPLGSDREAAVLDEAPRIDEVGEVLAGRPPVASMALRDRIRARLVAEQRLALAELAELGADLLIASVAPPGAHQAAILSTGPGCERRSSES